MKKILIIVIIFAGITSLHAQDWPRLNVTVKKGFNSASVAVYVEPIMPDYILAIDILKSSFIANGFQIVNNKNKADLILTMSYKDRSDMGCSGGRVIKKLEGKICEAKGLGETMVLFNFSQSGFEGKCTPEVFAALSKKIKSETLKK